MSGQILNDCPRLPVTERVHGIAVAEHMRRDRNGKIYTVFSGPLHRLLQPLAHGFIGDGPQRLKSVGPRGQDKRGRAKAKKPNSL